MDFKVFFWIFSL